MLSSDSGDVNMSPKDRANRTRWAKNQSNLARQNMSAEFDEARNTRIATLRKSIEEWDARPGDITPTIQTVIALWRVELARLEA